MTKSQFINMLIKKHIHIQTKTIEKSVKKIIFYMMQALIYGYRIEIRGFGSFSLHFRTARLGRNPKTGDKVKLKGKYVPYFKAGKELRERVNKINKT